MRALHLFAGIGGSHLCGELLGWTSVGSVEIDPYCQAALRRHYPEEVIHGDIRTFDGRPLRGRCDLIAGGFPCQDISVAGKGAGIEGERSGLWAEFARVIREIRPSYVYVENVPALTSRGLGRVLGDLASLGFDAEWGCLSAAQVGANHRRDRLWILAYARSFGSLQTDGSAAVANRGEQVNGLSQRDGCYVSDPNGERVRDMRGRRGGEAGEGAPEPADDGAAGAVAHAHGDRQLQPGGAEREERGRPGHGCAEDGAWWAVEPDVCRVAHGIPRRVDRIRGLGNAWVPLQAAEAFRMLWARAFGEAPS